MANQKKNSLGIDKNIFPNLWIRSFFVCLYVCSKPRPSPDLCVRRKFGKATGSLRDALALTLFHLNCVLSLTLSWKSYQQAVSQFEMYRLKLKIVSFQAANSAVMSACQFNMDNDFISLPAADVCKQSTASHEQMIQRKNSSNRWNCISFFNWFLRECIKLNVCFPSLLDSIALRSHQYSTQAIKPPINNPIPLML